MKNLTLYIVLFILFFISSPAFSQYTEQDKYDLIVTLQEEKVAYDFYSEMYNKYNQKVFGNIVESEKTHFDHVYNLLTDLGIDASEYNTATGVFQNREMTDIYNMLTEMGSYSLEDALRASAKYEENDLNDLRTYSARTDNDAIKDLYSCLEQATENHLRAFVRNLKSEGINYKPKVLSEDEYNRIISSENTKGDCFLNR